MSIYDTLNTEQREAVFIQRDLYLFWQEPVQERQGFLPTELPI